MKKIVIFCDGTWNTPDEEENGLPCATNISKMALATSDASKDGTAQLMYYDVGIGTEGNSIQQIIDGATGTGISNNILQAYEFIIKNYRQGDQLFLFGFSRGAFTVRSLAGLIRNCGILKPEFINKINQAYNIYKSRNPIKKPNEKESILFRKSYAVENITQIEFIGIFDTVGALGNPLFAESIINSKNQFHDTQLSSYVNNAFHALAIDEKRKNFNATLWYKKNSDSNQNFQQMWFCGVHSDIGGGYPEHDLSDISLLWMLEKAEGCGLNFNTIEQASTSPNSLGMMHESYKGIYKLYSKYDRPIGEIDSLGRLTNEEIHPSVIQRYHVDASYRPKKLVDYINKSINRFNEDLN